MKKDKNKFEKFFYNNKKNIMNKWDHYFHIYDRHFNKYKDQDIVLLEVGVSNGGSLMMWKDYFGKNSKIYGIDIDPRCKEFEKENLKIFIGSQTDLKFLNTIKTQIPKVDILIDDGGHFMDHQIITFNELFNHIIKVKKTNVAIIMVEQNAKQALSISDRGYVLVTGKNKFEGSGKQLLHDPEVRRSFLGA